MTRCRGPSTLAATAGRTQRSVCVLSAEALVHASAADVHTVLSRQPTADLVVTAEAMTVAVLLPGLQRLARARELLGQQGELVVRTGTAERHDLLDLAKAGVRTIGWTVRAPTRLAAQLRGGSDREVAQLHAAMQNAATAGLRVQLRWRLDRSLVPALAGLDELAEHAPHGTQLVIVPGLGDDAPNVDEVTARWPHEGVPGLTLVRSALWPACIDLPSQDVDPISATQIKTLCIDQVPACATCPERAACPGVAPALVRALADAGQAFRGWFRPAKPHPELPPPQEPTGLIGFDPHCAEARGLHLGLRRAWRMSLRDSDVARFRSLFEPLGYTVAVSQQGLDMAVGGSLRLATGALDDAERLVVIARMPELAHACLRDELDNVARGMPDTAAGCAADLRDTLAVHRRLGAAYGYPSCCIEAFCEAHREVLHTTRLADNAIALVRAHLRSLRYDALLDTLGGPATDAVVTPLRHLPCRFDCPASLALAWALLDDLRALHPARAHQVVTHEVGAVVVLADGSFVRVAGRLSGPLDVESVSVLTSQTATHAPAALRDQLRAIEGRQPPDTALRVTPGVGVALRRAGAWRDLDVACHSDGPALPQFPLLLPFQRYPRAVGHKAGSMGDDRSAIR